MWSLIWMTLAAAMPLGDLDWFVVNDTVMGGVSQSTVQIEEHLSFAGVLSLERNGGFASIRANVPRGSFAGAAALRLELKGDGRTYDITLRRSDIPLRAGSYRVRVTTTAEPTVVSIPLGEFRPTSFGRPVPGAPALDAATDRIATVGVMLADKQPGPFEMEILSMEIVRDESLQMIDREPAIAMLLTAIEQGVGQFNRGDHAGCARTYETALSKAIKSQRLTPGEVSIIEEAMDRTHRQSPTDAAWTLRYAMDSVLYTGV